MPDFSHVAKIYFWKIDKSSKIERRFRLMNKISVGNVDKDAETTLSATFVSKTSPSYAKHPLHMFAENAPAREHHEETLN